MTADTLAEAFSVYARLVGADVLIMETAFASEYVVTSQDAIGWRGEVTEVRGGSVARAQVKVFGSWFALSDTTRVRPIGPL